MTTDAMTKNLRYLQARYAKACACEPRQVVASLTCDVRECEALDPWPWRAEIASPLHGPSLTEHGATATAVLAGMEPWLQLLEAVDPTESVMMAASRHHQHHWRWSERFDTEIGSRVTERHECLRCGVACPPEGGAGPCRPQRNRVVLAGGS